MEEIKPGYFEERLRKASLISRLALLIYFCV